VLKATTAQGRAEYVARHDTTPNGEVASDLLSNQRAAMCVEDALDRFDETAGGGHDEIFDDRGPTRVEPRLARRGDDPELCELCLDIGDRSDPTIS
jgi:hypothetical protein